MARRFLKWVSNVLILLLKHIFIILLLFLSLWLIVYVLNLDYFTLVSNNDKPYETILYVFILCVAYYFPYLLFLYILIEVVNYLLNDILKINLRYWILTLCIYLIFAPIACEEVIRSIVLIANHGIKIEKLLHIQTIEGFKFFSGLFTSIVLILLHHVFWGRKDKKRETNQSTFASNSPPAPVDIGKSKKLYRNLIIFTIIILGIVFYLLETYVYYNQVKNRPFDYGYSWYGILTLFCTFLLGEILYVITNYIDKNISRKHLIRLLILIVICMLCIIYVIPILDYFN